ncbi:uncharacterized protein LOC133333628 [Musca vetustissima]|uniref:uncharacterized protein LOC133333628 n=1 Tax=Musca vetustissima TaxID=27455 RepID=UPI002AB624A9|nr:uncharacterized protein LOC133333628 [Musca vetustissima]
MRKLFGLPLRTAAIVVGSLSVLLFLYASIHTTYNLVQFMTQEKVTNSVWIIDPDTGEISHRTEVDTRGDTNSPKAQYTGWIMDTDTATFYILYTCLSWASLITSICLIVGGMRYNNKLLLPWLVMGVVTLTALSLCLIYTVYLFIIYSLNGWCVEASMIIVLVAAILLLGLEIYLWRGIQLFYMELMDGRERRKMLPTTVPLYSQDEFFY